VTNNDSSNLSWWCFAEVCFLLFLHTQHCLVTGWAKLVLSNCGVQFKSSAHILSPIANKLWWCEKCWRCLGRFALRLLRELHLRVRLNETSSSTS